MAEKIALCPNIYRDNGLKCTLNAKRLLEKAGYKVVISPIFTGGRDRMPPNIATQPLDKAISGARLVVSFGGDGTILHTARAALGKNVPIIGVNLGTKGFMADLEPDDIDKLIPTAKGDYSLEKRMMLDVNLMRGGESIYHDHALNDVVISGIAHTIKLKAWSDGQPMSEFSGDGVILATPTGSTAYSMSAGGPLVEPTAENIIMTPICPHALAARSFVLAPSRTVKVQAVRLSGKKRAVLSVDGGDTISLRTGDELVVSRSKYQTLLAHVGNKSFYDIAYEKLGERT
jgi:NAD+ kinase